MWRVPSWPMRSSRRSPPRAALARSRSTRRPTASSCPPPARCSLSASRRAGALLLALLLAPAAAFATLPATALKGKKVLFVIAQNGKDRASDDLVKRRMATLGFAVTVADEADPATKADGHDLVVI